MALLDFLIPKKTVDKVLTQRLRTKGLSDKEIASKFGVKEKDLPAQALAVKVGEGLAPEQKKAAQTTIQKQVELAVKQPTKIEQLQQTFIAPGSIASRAISFLFPESVEQRKAKLTLNLFDKNLSQEQKKLVQEQITSMTLGAVGSIGNIERQIIKQAEKSLSRSSTNSTCIHRQRGPRYLRGGVYVRNFA